MLLQVQNSINPSINASLNTTVNIPVKKLPQLDTLRDQIHTMQLKMDSLEKIVLKTEIGTGFFSDVISSNLYTYTAIIGLTALISWGWITIALRKQKQFIEANLKIKIDKLNDEVSVLKRNLKDTDYHTNRSMYWNTISNKAMEIDKFRWAIRTVCSYLEANYREEDQEAGLDNWLKKSFLHLENTPDRDLREYENDSKLLDFLHLKLKFESNKKIWYKIRIMVYTKLATSTESPTES